MPKRLTSLTQDRLKEVVSYNPKDGLFVWKIHTRKPRIGTIAGTEANARGTRYILVRVDGRLYRGHRLAWLYVYGSWPTKDIDHKDGDETNNRIDNLRECTVSQNIGNSRRHKDNTSGVKGVRWRSDKGKWNARIKGIHLGYFDNVDDAAVAYRKAAERIFGEFARTA